jgi:hypothetical protein
MTFNERVPKRSRLLEFWLAAALIGVATTFLLPALWRIEEDAERLLVESTIRNINSGLRLAESELVLQGREAERRTLLLANPVTWLESPPTGYVECDRIEAHAVEAGQWVWERETRLLHYRPRHSEHLQVQGGGTLAWRVVAAGDGVVFRPGALRIENVTPYDWQP